jgi:hypothetical protein
LDAKQFLIRGFVVAADVATNSEIFDRSIFIPANEVNGAVLRGGGNIITVDRSRTSEGLTDIVRHSFAWDLAR